MKILLVDDEKKFAMMLSKRLALRGIEVDYVYTAEEAVAKVESNNYDVAILDVKMPGIGGIELERKLKAMVPRPTLQPDRPRLHTISPNRYKLMSW